MDDLTETVHPTAALEDIRVLQGGRGKSAAFCAKLLADLGARVTVVDAVSTPLQEEGPFHLDDTGHEWGGLHLYLDAGKDIVEAAGAEELAAAVPGFDVLIEDDTSSRLVLIR